MESWMDGGWCVRVGVVTVIVRQTDPQDKSKRPSPFTHLLPRAYDADRARRLRRGADGGGLIPFGTSLYIL